MLPRFIVRAFPALVAWLSLPAPPAEACGGTFCDAGPMTTPVNQAAETVLFVRDGADIEAHIQITIDPTTDAQKFAWVVPMPAVPQFAVGSQPLFDALLTATSPSFFVQGDSCSEFEEDGGAFIVRPDGGAQQFEPEVTSQVVGAFEVTVLSGGTVDAVMSWLGNNGYAQDPNAAPILADYLADGHVLVAFKLIPSASSADIHPIVLRYEGSSPCVPIRLTAIAAQENMGVRALVLGDTRWVPSNYRHVVLNELTLPWDNPSAYDEVVTLAVDEAPAGHGFTTEYAGPTPLDGLDTVYAESWNAEPFETVAPENVVALLDSQGFSSCHGIVPCVVNHPLVVAMLRAYLPAPESTTESQYYSCLSCYIDVADLSNWDAATFAAELDARVIQPGLHARELMSSWPYLTRLYTTISPAEMTIDPEFRANADLPDQPALGRATRVCVECSENPEDGVVTLPGGMLVYQSDQAWPTFPDMPRAARIETIGPAGAPIIEVDNRADIHAQLQAHNSAAGCLPPGTDTGGVTDTGGPGSMSTSGASGGIETDTGEGSSSADAGQDEPMSGCGCTGGPAGAPGLVVAVALGRRRRRPRRPTAADPMALR